MTTDHHEHDRIVELCRTPNRFEADVMVAKLREAGITASVNYGGFGSTVPHYSIVDGNAVLVFDCDLERAVAVLDGDAEPATDYPRGPDPAPEPHRPPERGRRRH